MNDQFIILLFLKTQEYLVQYVCNNIFLCLTLSYKHEANLFVRRHVMILFSAGPGCVTMASLMDMLVPELHSLPLIICTRTLFTSFQKVDGK